MKGRIPSRIRATVLDLGNYCLSSVADYLIHFVIRFDSRIDVEKLRRAYRLSLDAEPVMGCRFVDGLWRPRWVRRDDLDNMDFCQVVETEDTEKEVIDFLARTADCRSDPLVQAAVVRGGADTLCVKINHVACDAEGAKAFLYRMFEIHNRLSGDTGCSLEPSDTGLRSSKELLGRFSLNRKAAIARSGLRNCYADSKTYANWRFPQEAAGDMKKAFITRRVGWETYSAITEYRRRKGYTLNDVMLAAYFSALYGIIHPDKEKPLCVTNVIDLRRFLPEQRRERVCNHTQFLNSVVRLVPDMSFDEIAETVHVEMKKRKSDYPGLGDMAVSFGLFRLFPFCLAKRTAVGYINYQYKTGKVPPALSNLGSIDNNKLTLDGSEASHAYIVAPLAYPPCILTAFSTFNGTITLAAGFSESHFRRGDVESLLESMVNAIQQAIFGEIRS
ncbi:MAG: hypothetical protein ACYS8W_05370 [Planctomycetota bacterium]